MKFEKKVSVRTYDGVDHDSIEAAKKHLFRLNFATLGSASAEDIEQATAQRDTEDPHLKTIRDALREVTLVAWPRAARVKAGEAAPKPEETVASEPERPEPEPAPEEVEAPAERATSRKSRH